MARETYNPLIQSTVEETLVLALRAAEEESFNYLRDRRQFCMDFYHNEVLMEDGGDNSYLKNFFGYQNDQGTYTYREHLLLEHLPVTEQLIDLKAKNYKLQPNRKVEGNDAEVYQELLQMSGWFSTAKVVEQYTQLLSDIAVGVFLKPDRKTLQFMIIPDYYPIFDEEKDPMGIEPVALIYPTAMRTDNGSVIYAYYDDEQYVKLLENGEVIESEPNTYGLFNFFFVHRKKPAISHFTTPRTSLAMANQNIDVALSSLNHVLHYNGFKKLVITGRVDKDKDVDADVKFAMGNGQVLLLSPGIEGETPPDVKALDLQVDFEQHITALKFKFEAAANTLNMAFQWKIEGGPQSGKSLEIQNARDTEDREIIRENLDEFVEQPLFRIVTGMSEKFGLGVEKGRLSVDWQDPEPTESVSDEIAWEKHKLDTNQVSVIDLMMEDNPEMTEEEAVAKYKANLKIKSETMKAMGVPNGPQARQEVPGREQGGEEDGDVQDEESGPEETETD